MDAVRVALGQERHERLDALRLGVEVLDAEAVAAEARAGVGERAQVAEVVAVAGVGDHDPRGSTPAAVSEIECQQTGLRAGAFVCTITGAPVSTLAAAIIARMRGTSPMSPCSSTAHLRKAALTPGVVDALAQLADEELAITSSAR